MPEMCGMLTMCFMFVHVLTDVPVFQSLKSEQVGNISNNLNQTDLNKNYRIKRIFMIFPCMKMIFFNLEKYFFIRKNN